MTDRDLAHRADDLADWIEQLDAALIAGDRRAAREALAMLEPAKQDPSLCTEVTQSLYHGGLLVEAERWAEIAHADIERGRPASFATRKDLLWLRANIAWQSGRFRAAAMRFRECAKRVGPTSYAEALAYIADAPVVFEASPMGWLAKSKAKRLAERALAQGEELVQVRHGAGLILKVCAKDDALLRAIADDPTLDDPEGLAYRESAAVLLDRTSSFVPRDAMNPIEERNFRLAQRYAKAIVAAMQPALPVAPDEGPVRSLMGGSPLEVGALAY
jgi:hypothetical protein